MFIVHVNVHGKPGKVKAFREATAGNARNSLQEPGVARFDVIQQQDDDNCFVLAEVYRTAGDLAKHKGTAHLQRQPGGAGARLAASFCGPGEGLRATVAYFQQQ